MTLSRRVLLLSSAAVLAGASALPIQSSGANRNAARRVAKKYTFKIIENVWIPLQDGTRLAARLWLPDAATPVPVVLEYLPYRKRDMTRTRDDQWAAAFVPYGFAFVRVDIRGSGESDGVLKDEYLSQEQADAVEVIAWLAKQSWSSGSVGMRGISWGGFNSLQVAAKAPPALKAIVTHCATDNRYTDDAHYVGGALTFDMLDWGAQFKTVLIGPPDPAIVGDRWRGMWQSRLEAASPIFSEWLGHQRYDAFWQQGSVAMDYGRIQCPVYVVGGQIDSYRNFIPRLLSHLKVPHKGVMGPWGHRYPQNADPGPGLDWAAEEARWWTQWLIGTDTGIMKEPVLEAYMEYRIASETWPKDTPGRWVAEKTWPSATIDSQLHYLSADGLSPTRPVESEQTLRSIETLGITHREWFPNEFSSDLPPDQTPDDRRSMIFDSPALAADTEILGQPSVTLRISCNVPVAKVAVRINEVTPDGKSWSVSYGILNLTHRDGHEHPTALELHRKYDVQVPCYFTAHRFKKGSRIRVALSESLWPLVWPSPQAVEMQVVIGRSWLSLPVRPMEAVPYAMPMALIEGRVEQAVAADQAAAKAAVGKPAAPGYSLTQSGPDAEGRAVLHKIIHEAPLTLDTGETVTESSDWYWSIREGDPNSSLWKMQWSTRIQRGTWDTTIRGNVELTSTATEFHVKESVHALEGDKSVLERSWNNTIKRDFM